MAEDANGEQVAADRRAARLALVRAYLQTPDALTREALLAQMVASLSADERAAGMARFGDWALDRLPADLAQTPDYARYQDLLPQVLAGTLAPQSADARWFQTYLEQCDPCFEEYQELRHALDAERAADDAPSGAGATMPGFPLAEQPVLHETGTPYTVAAVAEAATAWRTGVRAWVERRAEGSSSEVQVRFEALPPGQGGTETEVETRTLIAQALGPNPARGVTLLVQAQRVDPITCRLVVHLSGPGQHAGRPAWLTGPEGLAQEDVTDERGGVSFFLPIVALAQSHLSLSLEPERDLK